jgi:hypothetical protein
MGRGGQALPGQSRHHLPDRFPPHQRKFPGGLKDVVGNVERGAHTSSSSITHLMATPLIPALHRLAAPPGSAMNRRMVNLGGGGMADWGEFGWGDRDEPGPQTEDSVERGFRPHGAVDDAQGRSDSLDPDNVGDIADEGPGHRG